MNTRMTTRGSGRGARLLFFALVVLLTGCARTMIPTPLLYDNTSIPLFGELAPELDGNVLPVLYATDRAPEHDEAGSFTGYGSTRSPSGALGVARVRLPVDGADSTSSTARELSVEAVEELVRFPATPYLYRVGPGGRISIDADVSRELAQTTAQARRELTRRLALTPKKDVYVYVHGVGTNFEEVMVSTAEFWHFLGREGLPIVYTWPAGAPGLFFYTVDRESGEFTVLHLKQFLRFLAGVPEVERIHIIAHSRGTDVVITALRELIIHFRAAGLDPRVQLKVENLVLVAADIDVEVEMQRVAGEAMGAAFGNVTIYTNARDDALAAATSLFSSRQRLGTLVVEEFTERQRAMMQRLANVDLIVYEGSGGGFFKHSYYQDPAVSSDVLALLRFGWRPGEGTRQGLQRVDENINIWRIGANYLAPGTQ